VKIYTRTGDAGETSLFDGTRVKKDDPRVDAYGELDELNAWIGFVRAAGIDADLDSELDRIQREVFALSAHLADPRGRIRSASAKTAVGDGEVEALERFMDACQSELAPLNKFILPGGCTTGAALHLARTVCRRAERRLVALRPEADASMLRYLNRLSDLLFVLARVVNRRASVPETKW
jgi:cob(I)alamin adenosyltransferase